MLYAGLDLSRKRLDFCLLDQRGEKVEVGAAPPDADGLRGLAARIGRFREPVVAAIESMNGARFVHDQLEQADEAAAAIEPVDSRPCPGAADEHGDDEVVRDCEQPPLDEDESARERLGVRDFESGRIVGHVFEREGRVLVSA